MERSKSTTARFRINLSAPHGYGLDDHDHPESSMILKKLALMHIPTLTAQSGYETQGLTAFDFE